MMTDSRDRALAAALEYWRNVDPVSFGSVMSGHANKAGGSYDAEKVVATARQFADFLDGKEEKKLRR